MIPGVVAGQMRAAGGLTPAQSILNSLISWWDFEVEIADYRFADLVGISPMQRNSVYGTYLTASGKVGNSLDLSGSMYVSVRAIDSAPLTFDDQSFSLVLWHYRNSTNNPAEGSVAYLAGRYRTTGNARSYTCRVLGGASEDNYQFGVSADGVGFVGVLGGVYSYTAGWDFIVCGYDKEAGHIFISTNGGPKVTTPHTGGVYSGGDAQFAIGTSLSVGASTAGFKNGRYDSVAVVGKALTDAEIAVLWNGGAGLNHPELVAAA